MPLSELDIAKVRRYQRVPERARHQVRLEVEAERNTITIVERRAPWRPEYSPEWTRFPIARLRYTTKTKLWTLYWRDRNLRFHRYDALPPSPSIDVIIDEMARDPTRIFWGWTWPVGAQWRPARSVRSGRVLLGLGPHARCRI